MLKRKKRTLSLPSSVSLEDAEKYWEGLSFNKSKDAIPKAFHADSFVLAQESVEKYRRLARAGRQEMEKKEQLLAGQPKIVYGQGVYVPEISPFFPEPSTAKSEQVSAEHQESSTEQTQDVSAEPQEPSMEQTRDASAESSKDASEARPTEESVETK